ncbi:MAG: ribonuclease P [Methanothrix sp.]|uniref:Rpp14/Pop5 family protein n=1 Tax=Methanothrix sp. TaxID=90426 RepID=UPI0025E05ADB|nr:Rpp14/Pop5 family protein [Methanothrix sp.]MCQ8902946.1 ribonuclease P [Methanothrix sp.]
MRSRLPVMRDRRRYMVFELESEGHLDARDISLEIQSSYLSLFGDSGGANPRLISFDGRFGIVRCRNGHAEELRAALATVHTIAGFRAAIRVRGVSGTIKTATEKYIPQSSIKPEEHRRRVDLKGISGVIVSTRGHEIDVSPDGHIEGLDTRYLGLTYFDLEGGCDYADGTSDGV